MATNNDNVNVTRYRGPGFFGLLTLVFITLKLCGVIDWAWVWVLAPLWMPLTVLLGVMFFVFVAVLITAVLVEVGKTRR